MRADEGALIALHAVFLHPLGNHDGDAALFILRGTRRNGAVRIECRRGQLVAFQRKDGGDDALEVVVVRKFDHLGALRRGRPRSGDVDLDKVFLCGIDRGVVHLNDRVALSRKGLVRHFLHEVDRLGIGQDLFVDQEERGLQDGVRAVAQPEFARNADRVDDVKVRMLLCEHVLDFRGKVRVQLFHRRPGSVQQEGAAFLEVAHHVVTDDVGRIVAGDEVRRVDEVFALNGRLAESEVGNGDAARLLGVIEEVRLRIHIGVVADDLDGVLVCTDRAVRTEAVELAARGAGGGGVELLGEIERGVRHVLVNTHGEVVLGLVFFKVLVDGKHHGGVEFLGTESVSAADDLDVLHALFQERGAYVEVERLAQRSGFLRSVENGDLLAALGNGGDERVRHEGTVQADFDKAVLLALCVELVDGFFHRLGARAHDDDDLFGVGSAHIVKQVVASARERVHLVHHLLHDGGRRKVVAVRRLAVLEVGVAVLRGAALNGMLGVEGACAEFRHVLGKALLVEDRLHLLIGNDVDLGDFVRGTEAVKEIDERHACAERGQMRHEREVHDLLHRAARDHREARLTARHDVLMVAEDVQRMRGDRARGDVHDHGQQFARNFVHVGDHQQKSLRRGVRRRQRACRKRAVHRARSAALRLHLCNAELLSPHVQPSLSRPFIRGLRHGRRGGDGVDRRNFRESISDVRRGGIAVNRHLGHRKTSIKTINYVHANLFAKAKIFAVSFKTSVRAAAPWRRVFCARKNRRSARTWLL